MWKLYSEYWWEIQTQCNFVRNIVITGLQQRKVEWTVELDIQLSYQLSQLGDQANHLKYKGVFGNLDVMLVGFECQLVVEQHLLIAFVKHPFEFQVHEDY